MYRVDETQYDHMKQSEIKINIFFFFSICKDILASNYFTSQILYRVQIIIQK